MLPASGSAIQPVGPRSDTARMTFARQVADRDEESALVWAETVSDETMREGTINHIFTSWRLRNPGRGGRLPPQRQMARGAGQAATDKSNAK